MKVFYVEYDGFKGYQIGSYTTIEGKEGIVLQQVGTRVVHVYRRDKVRDVTDYIEEAIDSYIQP